MITKVKKIGTTVVDFSTKTAYSFKDEKSAKLLYMRMIRVGDCTPSRVFSRARRRKPSIYIDN